MYDSKVKMILLLLNKRGINVNWERKVYYSEIHNVMLSSHVLKFWYKGIRKNKKTGETEEYSYCTQRQFGNMINLLKYLVAIKDNKIEAGKEYDKEES